MSFRLKYRQYGESAILIEWPPEINRVILEDIHAFQQEIENTYSHESMECIPTYHSLLVRFRDYVVDESLLNKLTSLYEQRKIGKVEPKMWEIPVCYSPVYGYDLEAMARRKQLTTQQIIDLHTQATYTVYFMGFLPGFLYLGGLPTPLMEPRKNKPDQKIPRGSVAIGGSQTGIYPSDCPGGWHVIGKTPVRIFNPFNDPPSSIQNGDFIRFIPIDESEYLDIQSQIENESFTWFPTAL